MPRKEAGTSAGRERSAGNMVVVGELDAPDFQGIASTLERGIPSARKVVLPGVGHMANLAAPASARMNRLKS